MSHLRLGLHQARLVREGRGDGREDGLHVAALAAEVEQKIGFIEDHQLDTEQKKTG